jgi:hypothetical protein
MDKWKTHFWWMVAVTVVILTAVVTYWLGGKGNEIVSYISFASALVSIVLALVAIFYSFVQNVSSQQNIGEMKTLVSEASRIMTEKASTLANQAISMKDTVKQLIENRVTVSSTTTTPLGDDSFRFDASRASIGFLLTLYYMVKCYKLQKLMQLKHLGILVLGYSEEEGTIAEGLAQMYGIGVIQCLHCCFESENFIIDDQGQEVEIKGLPAGFERNILTIVDRQSKDDRYPKDRDRIERSIKKIDAHVEAARIE